MQQQVNAAAASECSSECSSSSSKCCSSDKIQRRCLNGRDGTREAPECTWFASPRPSPDAAQGSRPVDASATGALRLGAPVLSRADRWETRGAWLHPKWVPPYRLCSSPLHHDHHPPTHTTAPPVNHHHQDPAPQVALAKHFQKEKERCSAALPAARGDPPRKEGGGGAPCDPASARETRGGGGLDPAHEFTPAKYTSLMAYASTATAKRRLRVCVPTKGKATRL
jgi:hypothetical protein